MDISYKYVKVRKNFGREPLFCEVVPEIIDSINPDHKEQQKYCLRNPINQDVQSTSPFSMHEVNTKQVEFREQGVNHVEGGWPKEVNINDEEMTSRYKRRIERDDAYVDSILSVYPKFKQQIEQNNAIEMYEMYFKEMPQQKPVEKLNIRQLKICEDFDKRAISSIDWTPEENPKLVVSYCCKSFPSLGCINTNFNCSFWDLENTRKPIFEVAPPSACWQIICHHENSFMTIGGLQDGRVCIFDTRIYEKPVLLSPSHVAHKDPVSALLFVHSRLNNEFFTGSTDGMCKWWDIRNLQLPVDSLIISLKSLSGEMVTLSSAESVSSLQYDKAFPTKFLCGTESGLVLNVNRKGKTHKEMMSSIYHAHDGPVKALHRSICTSKIFITCGEYNTHIWNEEIHSSPIISGISQKHQLNDVTWAPFRLSAFMTASDDGKFRYWDLLRKFQEPVLSLNLSNNRLLKVKPHADGKIISIGDDKGKLYLLSLSDNMVISDSTDKTLLTQIFDRETRREHILENRVKEIRLKQKGEDAVEITPIGVGQTEIEADLDTITKNYMKVVSDEMFRQNIPQKKASSSGRTMRFR